MGSLSRSGAILIALFGSFPILVFVTWMVWELFVYLNGGTPPDPSQAFKALFAGFAFALAAFTCLYACRSTRE
ncbi:MAG: hypothetical protein ACK2UR_20245 [Candidatus Promineifilaceae bacterium]|jgi:hypothetical protein